MTRSRQESDRELDARIKLNLDHRQVTAAAASVGSFPKERLAWLMRFVEADLATSDDLTRWSLELEMFSCTGSPYEDRTRPCDFPFRRATDASPTDVVHIQADIRRGLQTLRTKGEWYFEAPAWRGLVKAGQAMSPVVSGTAHEMVMAAVADLLVALGPKLRVCEAPGCDRYFVLGRPHQRRCSDRCTNRVTAARYREAHREQISDQRHRAYKKRIRVGKPQRRRGVGGRKRKPA